MVPGGEVVSVPGGEGLVPFLQDNANVLCLPDGLLGVLDVVVGSGDNGWSLHGGTKRDLSQGSSNGSDLSFSCKVYIHTILSGIFQALGARSRSTFRDVCH